jgi:ubiquinol-cytochrome c reductase iron-sulfur subunit
VTQPTRRNAIVVAASGFTLVGAGAAVWPLIDQFNPDANERANQTAREYDLSHIAVGQNKVVLWQDKTLFIRHRTQAEIDAAKRVPLADLMDTYARNLVLPDNAPATDQNRTQLGHEEWLVVVGVCSHERCIPKGSAAGDVRGEFGGWFCPCCAAQFDTSGRVRKGPAPTNLVVPQYEFVAKSGIAFLSVKDINLRDPDGLKPRPQVF